MKVKELIKKASEDPNYINLPEISMIKKIYIELGLNRTFSPEYYFGNSKTKAKIYSLAESKSKIAERVDNKTIICCSLARQFEYLFRELGYYCTVIKEDHEHVYNLLRLKDGRLIGLDLQRDLEFIQTGRRTRFFGATENKNNLLSIISDEEQIKIDRDIRYPNTNGEYNDKRLDQIKKNLKGLSLGNRIKLFLQNEDILQMTISAGYMQKYAFYYNMIKELAEDDMWQKVYIIPCRTENDYTNIIYVKEKNSSEAFIYSQKNQSYMGLKLSTIPKLEEQGLRIGIKGKEKGVNLLRRDIKTNRGNVNR